jgi:DNA-binding MarR family transcriptional regulator
MAEDFADRHVARWRDHWIDIDFDDEIEAATVRLMHLDRYLTRVTRAAVRQVGLQDYEYETLHRLMIRDTPGRASPGALAESLGVSAAGMTGRIDSLERAGHVKRTPSETDRRRIDVEATQAGVTVWRQAMALRGEAEVALMSRLTRGELATLNRLLKKLALYAEEAAADQAR